MVLPLLRPYCCKGASFVWKGESFKALNAVYEKADGEMILYLSRIEPLRAHKEADTEWISDLGLVYAKELLGCDEAGKCFKSVEMHLGANPPCVIFCLNLP